MFEKKFLTERLFIREYRKTDIDSFLKVIRQPGIYATTYGIPQGYSRFRAEWWLKTIKENMRSNIAYEFGVFMRKTGRYIGNVGLINVSFEHNRADISYYIDKDYMNNGYATEAAQEMLKYGFEKFGFNKIQGVCMSCNPASRRVMEKIGMKFEGTLRQDLLKDGIYYDIDRLSILKSEYYNK